MALKPRWPATPNGFVVDDRDAVPHHVTRGRLDDQRALANRHGRRGRQLRETRLELGQRVAPALSLQFRQGGPLLPVPADVLPLISQIGSARAETRGRVTGRRTCGSEGFYSRHPLVAHLVTWDQATATAAQVSLRPSYASCLR